MYHDDSPDYFPRLPIEVKKVLLNIKYDKLAEMGQSIGTTGVVEVMVFMLFVILILSLSEYMLEYQYGDLI